MTMATRALIRLHKALDLANHDVRQMFWLTVKGTMTCIQTLDIPLNPTSGHKRILGERRQSLILTCEKVDATIIVSSSTVIDLT